MNTGKYSNTIQLTREELSTISNALGNYMDTCMGHDGTRDVELRAATSAQERLCMLRDAGGIFPPMVEVKAPAADLFVVAVGNLWVRNPDGTAPRKFTELGHEAARFTRIRAEEMAAKMRPQYPGSIVSVMRIAVCCEKCGRYVNLGISSTLCPDCHEESLSQAERAGGVE